LKSVSKNSIVFANNYYRTHHINGLPNPVIVAVDINTHQPDIPPEVVCVDQLVYIIAVNKCTFCRKVIAPINILPLDVGDVFHRTIDHKATPISDKQQQARIRFTIVFNPELHKCPRYSRQLFNKPVNNPILTPLRKAAKLHIGKNPNTCEAPVHFCRQQTLDDQLPFGITLPRTEHFLQFLQKDFLEFSDRQFKKILS